MEIVGDKLADVGGMWEVVGGFGLSSPAAEEFEDGKEKLVFRNGRGRGGGCWFVVSRFEFVECFDGAEHEAESREIHFRRKHGGFLVPDGVGAVIAGFGGFLRGETNFGGIVGLFDDPHEADALGGFRETFLGEVVADCGIGW